MRTAGGPALRKAALRTARPGGTVDYRVSVTNYGPAAAANVVIKDPLGAAALVTPISLSGECALSAGTLSCALGTFAAGETRLLTARVRVNADVPDGAVLGNCSAVYSSTEDRDPELDHIQSCVNTVVSRPFVPVTG